MRKFPSQMFSGRVMVITLVVIAEIHCCHRTGAVAALRQLDAFDVTVSKGIIYKQTCYVGLLSKFKVSFMRCMITMIVPPS